MADKIHNINDYINYESKYVSVKKLFQNEQKSKIQLYVYERYAQIQIGLKQKILKKIYHVKYYVKLM